VDGGAGPPKENGDDEAPVVVVGEHPKPIDPKPEEPPKMEDAVDDAAVVAAGAPKIDDEAALVADGAPKTDEVAVVDGVAVEKGEAAVVAAAAPKTLPPPEPKTDVVVATWLPKTDLAPPNEDDVGAVALPNTEAAVETGA
jgi:hypothetical protein